MTRESLARKFRPAGFEQPEGSRRDYIKPRPELQDAFDLWVGELPETHITRKSDQYEKALKLIDDFGEISYIEANSLLIGFRPKTKNQRASGLFVSACYAHSHEDVIIFNLEASEVNYIGYSLGENNTLVNDGQTGDFLGSESLGYLLNNGRTGHHFGAWSSGIVLNNGKTKHNFAAHSSGVVVNNGRAGYDFGSTDGLAINNGDCGDWFGWGSSGLVIAVKWPESFGCYGYYYGYKGEALVLNPGDCAKIPYLKNYLEELTEITKSIKDEASAKKFLEKYGPEPKEKIELEIKELLRKG